MLEEKQTILSLGAGAVTKFVQYHGKQDPLITRVENVKDVKHYIERTDEMIQRKITKMEEIAWH